MRDGLDGDGPQMPATVRGRYIGELKARPSARAEE